jgi:hypothetical protein
MAWAVIDPLFEFIYDRVLDDTVPCLEMGEKQFKAIVDEVLTPMVPVMKDVVDRSHDNQVNILIRLHLVQV